MGMKLIIEFNKQGRVFSLDEFTKSFLEAIQRIVHQEVKRLLAFPRKRQAAFRPFRDGILKSVGGSDAEPGENR